MSNKLTQKLIIGTTSDNGNDLQVNGMITAHDDETKSQCGITTAKFKQKNLERSVIWSTEAPVNPDANPSSTVWVHYTGNNPKSVVAIYQHINGKWNTGSFLKQVYTGWQHSVFLLDDNTVWVSGDNVYGQLGLGTTQTFRTMIQLDSSFDSPNKIIVGQFNTIIEKSDGTVWGCGDNNSGQLGLGHKLAVNTFTQFSNVYNNPNKISILSTTLYIERSDGTVWATGYNGNGNLCQGTTGTVNNSSSFLQIASIISPLKILNLGSGVIFQKSDGTLWGAGYSAVFNNNTSANTGTLTQLTYPSFTEIYAMDGSIYLKQADGTLQVIGNNTNYQLGLGDTTIRKTFIALTGLDINKMYPGYYNMVVTKNDGTVWVTGRNQGQYGPTINNGFNFTTFTQIPNLLNILNISSNYGHSFIELNNKDFMFCGWNTQGELGDGSELDYNREPVLYTYK